jgi:hypothetical protein
MKLYHATTLIALAGWYLIVPPVDGSRPGMMSVGVLSPLSKWDTADRYNSAFHCREALNKLIDDFEPPKGDSDVSLDEQSLSGASKSAKCIASDDPRLAK